MCARMIIKDIQYTIPLKEVLLRLQYNVTVSEMSESVRALIDDMMNEGYILAEPRAIIKDFTIKAITDSTVVLTDTDLMVPSRSLAAHVCGCYKITFLICSIGAACGQAVQDYIEAGELAKAATLDAVASEAVEACTDSINQQVNQHAAAEGARTMRRFSTGYGDWSVAEQARLAHTLQAERIGVTVNDSCLLLPEKTVSACIGWRKKDLPVRTILEGRA